MKFKIRYYFDGTGEVIVDAKNEEEAKQKWCDGDYGKEEEWGENYNIEWVIKLPKKVFKK